MLLIELLMQKLSFVYLENYEFEKLKLFKKNFMSFLAGQELEAKYERENFVFKSLHWLEGC